MADAGSETLPELLQKIKSSHAELKRKLTADNITVVNLHYIARHAADYAERVAQSFFTPTEKPSATRSEQQQQKAQPAPQPPPHQQAPCPPAVKQEAAPPAMAVKQEASPPASRPTAAAPSEGTPAGPGDIVIDNLPVGWGSERVGLFLAKHKLAPGNITKAPNSTSATVHFNSGAGLQHALEVVPRQQVLGSYLTARLAPVKAAAEGQRREKRKVEASPQQQQQASKKAKAVVEEEAQEAEEKRDIRDAVCPWWNRPYHQQLRDKAAEVGQQLAFVTREVLRHTRPDARPQWAQERAHGKLQEGRCAPLLGILRSPQLEGYRNKSEFTCGRDSEGQLSVGFQLGLFREGFLTVESGHGCRHISPTALAYADMLQLFLRTRSALQPWDKTRTFGFWRLLTVREGRATTFLPPPGCTDAEAAAAPPFAELDPLRWLVDAPGDRSEGFPVGQPLEQVSEVEPALGVPEEVLVMVQVNPMGSVDSGAMDAELKALKALIREEEAKQGRPPAVLLLQHHTGVANAAPADAPLLPFPPDGTAAPEAPAVLHDTLCDLKFRISPTAFFQVNSPTACLLYRLAGQWIGAGPQTLLLDICCGTGTIGLTLARSVAKVVGVDIIESAVQDARANAELNGISNCEFIAGKAEEVLPKVLAGQASNYDNIAAIVDPPRAGLHKTVLRNLLNCSQIKRLVYVSCNPTTLAQNLTTLCMPPRRGEAHAAFTPVQAAAVDLFPHTRHVEGVVLLQR